MTGDTTDPRPLCPVARTAQTLGDRWSLLIIRDAFDGVRRFGAFQKSLGVARSILTARLRALVDEGVLAVQAASDGTSYQEYVLTAKGLSLFPLIVALRQWGEDHLYAPDEPRSSLVLTASGRPLRPMRPMDEVGREVAAGETEVRRPEVKAAAGKAAAGKAASRKPGAARLRHHAGRTRPSGQRRS